MTETNLPSIKCERIGDEQLVIDYRSPRRLCVLAEGLIYGAAEHYNTPIKIEHPVCMHRGSDHCDMRVNVTHE